MDILAAGSCRDAARGGRGAGDALAPAGRMAGHNAQRHDGRLVVEPRGAAVRADLQLGAHGRACARLLRHSWCRK